MSAKQINTKALWQQFSGHLRSFVRQRISDSTDAEDVIQDIFMRIHQGISKLRNEDKVQSWVFGIARRALADYYREKEKTSAKPDRGVDESNYQAEEDFSMRNLNKFKGEHDVHEEVLSWLIPMIDELPEMYRIPLKMAEVEGKTQQEIADRLDLSLSGAKSRVQRARQKLGEVLAACCEVEFGGEGRAVSYRKIKKEKCDDC